jgi:hypothetical protein
MRWLLLACALGLVGCGGPSGGETTPRSRAAKRATRAPTAKADYGDENNVGMTADRVGRWRWAGARKDCFYVVGNRCFTTDAAACKAAGCADVDDCDFGESAPVQVTCAKPRRK